MTLRALILIWLTSVSVSLAGLEFETQSKEVHAPAGARVVAANFPFSNPSSEQVTIDQASPNCSCIGIKVKGGKFTYAPGETGMIRAEFDMGNFSGTVDKEVAIWLKGDPKDKPSINLLIKVHIPELIMVDQKSVKWAVGDKPETKKIRVDMKHTVPIHITSINSSSKEYQVEFEPIEKGVSYNILITPNNTAIPGIAVIRFQTDCKISKYQSKQVFASTQRGEPKKSSLKP